MRYLGIIAALLLCTSASIARTPPWFERKPTRIDTYLACLNNILKMERAEGHAVPAFQNNGALPLIAWQDVLEGQREIIPFRLDVTGVDTLYMGASGRGHFGKIVLGKAGGAGVPLGKSGVKVVRSRWVKGPTSRIEIWRDGQVALKLGGRYTWIAGEVEFGPDVCWIDKSSRVGKYTRAYSTRRDAAHRSGLHSKYYLEMLPSGYHPTNLEKAVAILAEQVQARYAKGHDRVDAAILNAIAKAAASTKTSKEYDRLLRMTEMAAEYWRLQVIQREVDAVKAVPGLRKRFDETLRKRYFQLNIDRFNYARDMPKQEDVWDRLIKKTQNATDYAATRIKALEALGKPSPSTAAAIEELRRLDKELAARSGDLDAYFAKQAEMKPVFLKAFTDQTVFDFDAILINRNPPTKYSHNGDQHLGRHSRIGKGLGILTGWKEGKPQVKNILEGKMPPGAYRNPALSYDGKRVVFAFCDHTEKNPKLRRYFLYEAAIDGSWVRQLTGTHRDKFETPDNRATALIEDNDPCYLPSGEIVFISTRCQSFGRCHGGRYNPAWTLHKCDKDGNNIQQLSFGNENEVEPEVLNDGRIIFTRWEYTNRHEMFFHKLWWCRPDGTAVTHFFGNDMTDPHQFVEARPVPGSHKVAATAQGHHCYNTGTTVLLDTNIDENGEHAITHITPETPYSESRGWPNPHYSHPFPLTEELFLVSRANHVAPRQGRTPPPNDRAIYIVGPDGLREKLYEDPEVATVSPIPVQPRKTPPIIPNMTPPNAEPTGIVFLQNAYLTRNDPKGIIKPGMIKKLRINALGIQPRNGRLSCTWTVPNDLPKKVLGTVPIGKDGSAFFKVPANTALQMQILDENGMALLTEKSFFYLKPGENRSCIGCHEEVGSSPNMGAMAKMSQAKPMALTPAAGPQYKGGMSFARTVQPVLDRYCIDCHGLNRKAKGGVNLLYVPSARYRHYPQSLVEIVSRGKHRIGDKGFSDSIYSDYPRVSVNISRPRKFFAYENKVAHMLLKGDKHHPKLAKTDRESYMRIIEWLDLNGQCFGDLFPNRIEHRQFDKAKFALVRAYAKEVYGEKIAGQPETALVNAAQPDESRVLLMGLPVAKGGWGQVSNVFASKDDPKYKKMTAFVEASIVKSPNENTNGWQPTHNQGAAQDWVTKARADYLKKIRETLK